MRRLVLTPPRPNPRDECVERRSPVRATAAAIAVAIALGAALTSTTPVGAQATDAVGATDAEIARLQSEADALAAKYFDALAELTAVEGRIDDLERRLPELAQRVDELRAITRARAVAAYKRSGQALGTVIGADGPLHAARRAQWLGRLNARDDAVATELRANVDQLAAERADLRAARAAAEAALTDVRDEGRTMDALLADAQERRRVAALAPAAADPGAAATPAGPGGSATPATPAPATPGGGGASGNAPPPTAPPPPPAPTPPAYTPTPGTHPRHGEPFLVCTRGHESGGNYRAYNPAGPYMGAYQFLQTTWNSSANHAGRPELVGVPPHQASPYDQDDLAWALYQWQGSRPWGGRCG